MEMKELKDRPQNVKPANSVLWSLGQQQFTAVSALCSCKSTTYILLIDYILQEVWDGLQPHQNQMTPAQHLGQIHWQWALLPFCNTKLTMADTLFWLRNT